MTLLFVADHASAMVPHDIDLGIPAAWLGEHIAVDLGTAALTATLAADFGAQAIVAEVSRLVIDMNRPPHSAALIPPASDSRAIPGNAALSASGRQLRLERFHAPYHAAIAAAVAADRPALIVSVHSFTPQLASGGAPRPWPIGILYNRDDRAARLALDWLRRDGLEPGDNQPYSGRDLNYTMNRHAEAAGIPYLGIEVRQDLLERDAGDWAKRLTRLIADVRAGLDCGIVRNEGEMR